MWGVKGGKGARTGEQGLRRGNRRGKGSDGSKDWARGRGDRQHVHVTIYRKHTRKRVRPVIAPLHEKGRSQHNYTFFSLCLGPQKQSFLFAGETHAVSGC